MSKLFSLQKVVSCHLPRRYITFLRHTNNGHHNDDYMTSKESKNPAKIQPNKQNLVDDTTSAATLNRQRYINNLETFDLTALDDVQKDDVYTHNIEKYIGTVKIPIGVVNVDVNGMYAKGSYSVPMATTEAALVASYSRGCKMVSACGGVNTVVVEKPVLLSPEFCFGNISDANNFFQWFNCPEIFDIVKKAAETASSHGKLKQTSATLHGNKVLTKFVYESGKVSAEPGYRSTTAANVAIRELLQEAPVQPQKWWLNAVGFDHNSGPFTNSRSFYVTGEVICPKDYVEQILRTTVENLIILSESVMVTQYMQGVKGITCHASNGLAAIYIACGQDVACVAESQVGSTEMIKTPEGDIRVRTTIPSMMVATIGGGTGLPSQNTCLSMLQLPEKNSRDAFAEVIMGVLIGGELSVSAAMTAHHFSAAHQKFTRGSKH